MCPLVTASQRTGTEVFTSSHHCSQYCHLPPKLLCMLLQHQPDPDSPTRHSLHSRYVPRSSLNARLGSFKPIRPYRQALD